MGKQKETQMALSTKKERTERRLLACKPMYKIIFQNIRTGKEATVMIDAVTGQIHRELI